MAARFCSRCQSPALTGARFCHRCGGPLVPGAAAPTEGRRPTALGGAVLGFFILAGLGIWTAILAPTPPRPGPGGGRPRSAGDAASPTAGDLPTGHPRVELPAEVKTFIAKQAAEAREKPQDVDAWLKLAEVNRRAAQLDPAYAAEALAAFQHVLDLDPNRPEALRGIGNVHYDREEHKQAIPFYERYLALRPDDPGARTDLGTMYLYAGDAARALATFKRVVSEHPSFLQAHYNLGVTYHQQGDDAAALEELETARRLASDDGVRRQLDEMIARLRGEAPATRPPGGGAPSPFQAAVEKAFREHPIMGPRIVRFEWTAPGAGRVLVREFPMQAMPPQVREKFTTRLRDQLRSAQSATQVEGQVQMEIADASSGAVMATVTP